jgi:hypothetical protein
MAHFVKLDENNIVIDCIVIADELEPYGEQWCSDFMGGGIWKQTSYNTRHGVHVNGKTPFRKNYAGFGYTYDAQRDAFIPPKPFPSWVLDEFKCDWDAPKPHPNTHKPYTWDENTLSWVDPLPSDQSIHTTEF